MITTGKEPLHDSITTLTLFEYKGFCNKFWALQMMQRAKPYLNNTPGLNFYKLLGSGQDGFKPQPDWSVYALLQVWNSQKQAEQFFKTSILIKKYKKHSSSMCHIFMKAIAAHGLWSGKQPFVSRNTNADNNSPVAIITRASIKTSRLRKFWSYVPKTQKAIKDAQGLIYTKGFGEMPIWEMATFSLWENINFAKQYAYKTPEHQKAIKMTRQYNWYKEELFSRFHVYATIGLWKDQYLFADIDHKIL